MLPTFVIGLREGLEASLIVGIVAAFLRQQGRRDLLRWVFVGISASILLCIGVGVVLRVVSQNLPQRQQEGLETIIGAIAVGMVTYMVVWMRRHSRGLKGQLEGAAATAVAAGSGYALVAMAFLAVLREGFETVVFLLAAFNESDSGAAAGFGALLGIAVAVALGYGIYRGGVRINLSKFFRATGVVLVLVAAGLVVNALHTAHEAGWLDIGQQRTVDLSGVVRPGSVQASLLTGMLGMQPRPVLIEVIGWLVYLIPVGLYVGWPPGRRVGHATAARYAAVMGAVAALATVVLAVVAPSRPGGGATVSGGGLAAQVVSRSGDTATIRSGTQTVTARRTASQTYDGIPADAYTATVPGAAPRSGELSTAEVARRNDGRLPLGAQATGDGVPVRYTNKTTEAFWVEPRTGRIVDMQRHEVVTMTATLSTGPLPLGSVSDRTEALPRADVQRAIRAARHDITTLDRHRLLVGIAVSSGIGAAVALLTAGGYAVAARRERRPDESVPAPASELATH